MQKRIAVLALAVLLSACSESITPPESVRLIARGPQAVAGGNGVGSLHFRFDAGQAACNLWDTDEALWWVDCKITITESGGMGWVLTTEGKIPNSTGRAAVYNASRYPQEMVDIYFAVFGVTPRDGLMPVCDWDVKKYPDAYTTWDLTTLMCTSNWRYTISASGHGTFTARFDTAHTYYPFAP